MKTRWMLVGVLGLATAGCGELNSDEPGLIGVENLTAPVRPGDRGFSVRAVHDFLYRTGYFENPDLRQQYPQWIPVVGTQPSSDNYNATMETAVKAFQRLSGLTETGVVDGPTLALMQQPRCGYPDMDLAARDESQKFALNAWSYATTTTSISYGFTTTFSDEQKAAVKTGLDTWAAVTNLTFTENKANPSAALMKFKFGAISGCAASSLACTQTSYNPSNNTINGSTTTFNNIDYNWSPSTPTPSGQYDLRHTAIHESGHALGLDHSTLGSSVIYTFYNAARVLTTDDAQAISLKYSPWESIPGSAWEIAITPDDGIVYKLGTNTRSGGYEVSRWNESTRTWALAMNHGATHIAAATDDELWYTRNDNTVWNLEEDGAFQISPSPASPIADIGYGAGRVWVLSGTLATCGRTPYRWTGSSWQNMGSGGCGWKISVDNSGYAWVVNLQGAVKRYNGSSWVSAGSGNSIASDISVVPQPNGVGVGAWITSWMTEDANVPVKAWNQQGGSWVTPRLGANGAYIATGRFGQPWVLDVWQGSIKRQRRD